MAKTVVIDELHLTIRVPADLPDGDAETVREVLAGTAFMTRLRQVVRDTVDSFAALSACRPSLTR